MNIKNQNGQNNGASDEDHGEEQIIADKRSCERRGRVDVSDQQQEDDKRGEDGHTHRYLLSGVCRYIEQQHSHRAYDDTRQNEVDRVVKSFSSNCDVELDVGIRFRATRIKFLVLLRLDSQQIPLCALVVIVQIYA